jgi:hypothetical protein
MLLLFEERRSWRCDKQMTTFDPSQTLTPYQPGLGRHLHTSSQLAGDTVLCVSCQSLQTVATHSAKRNVFSRLKLPENKSGQKILFPQMSTYDACKAL